MSATAAADQDRAVAVGDRLTRAVPVLLVLVAIFPFLPNTRGLLGSAAQAGVFTLIAASLVLLTGWVGQISLAHGAFVGVGAYATGWAVNLLGVGFPLTLPVAALVAGGVAALLGLVALRVRGLYLAVATLIFSWAASEFLFRQDWLLAYGGVPLQTIGEAGMVFHVDFTSRMTFYYVAWGVTVGVLAALVSLRESRTGRAFFAIRGSETAAASLGMDVLRYKALAFALSGGLAGIAGNLTMSHALVVSPDAFDFNASLFFLAIAVVGGLTSLPGAVAAGVLFAAMNELFFQVAFLNEYLQLVSTGLLAVVFLLYPGGLAALGIAAIERLRQLRSHVAQLPGRVEAAVAGAAARVDVPPS
ncbi:MAG: branched-chain amino acid ABC transporter permease, partial [Thermoanaerobaculia bacterium]